jgi:hypothetical protein
VDDCFHAVTRRKTGCDRDERRAICAKYGRNRGLGASRFAGRCWYSLSRRAISTGAANRPRATQIGAATFRPQQSRSEQMSPTRARPAIALTLLAGRVNLEVRAAQSHTHTNVRSFSKNLIGCLRTGSGWRVEPGCLYTPPRRAPDPGAGRSPSLLLSSSEHYCRSSRDAPTGLRDAPPGPRVSAAPGERAMAPPRSTRRATSCSVLFQISPRSPLRRTAEGRFVRWCPEGGPSLFVSALKRPDDSSRGPPLLRRRSSRRTRVGRA